MNHRGSEGELVKAGHSHLNYSAREKLLALSLASHLLIKQVGDRELNKMKSKLYNELRWRYINKNYSLYLFAGIVIWAGFMWSQINALTYLAGKITYHL